MKQKIVKVCATLVCLFFVNIIGASATEKTYCQAKGGTQIITGIPFFVCPLQSGDTNCMYLCGGN